MRTICFEKKEMQAFADASGDLNPVHSGRHLGAAADGEAPVVYGVLAAMGALGAICARPGWALRKLEVSFHRPLLVGGRYQLQVDEPGGSAASVAIVDGQLPMLTMRVMFARGAGAQASVGQETHRLRAPCGPWQWGPQASRPVTGRYGASRVAAGWLVERFGLQARGVGEYAMHGLLHASYLVGMCLPGLGSLLARLSFAVVCPAPEGAGTAAHAATPLEYRASAVEFDVDLGEATVAGVIDHHGGRVATLSCQVRVENPLAAAHWDRELDRRLKPSSRLAGRVAAVIGASRGLGAALARGMALQGCTVYACSRGGPLAGERLPDGPGSIVHILGDGSHAGFCQKLLARIAKQEQELDYLLCCAAPRLSAIGFAADATPRLTEFVRRSIELVSVPMVTLLDAVDTRSGGCLVISSAALRTLPSEWSHYVVAKAANEALAAWSANQFPNVEMVVARVPALGGDAGERPGEALATAAARLVDRLAQPAGAGLHLVEW